VRGEMNPELEKVAFALQPGAVSEPIAVADGFRVLKLVERNEAGTMPFEEAKPEIVKRLGQARRAEEYERFVAGLRKGAIIDIRVREVPLQVDLTSTGSLLEPLAEPAAAPDSAPRPAQRAKPDDDEISATPQARPERVAPPGRPVPSPTPTPPPR
jgi:hypothetical protein